MARCQSVVVFIAALLTMVIINISNAQRTISRASIPPEKALIKALMTEYSRFGKYGRPIAYPNQSIAVDFSLELHSIIDVEDSTQPTLTIFCWLSQRWTDTMLTWEPSDYAGIEEIVLPIKDIWAPDTTLYNGLFTDDVSEEKTVVIQQNGAVAWILARTFKVLCERLDPGAFPYDGLKCFFKFGSWTTSGAKIRYSFASDENDFSMATFVPHPQWRVSSHFASKNELFYACCADTPFIDLTYHLKLRRAKHLPNLTPVFPLIILGLFMAVPFFMPANTIAKIHTTCTTFFATLIYGFILIFAVPYYKRNSSTITCFQMELINASIAIFLVTWFAEMRKFTYKPPHCISHLCHTLAVIVLCRCCILCHCCQEKRQSYRQNQSEPSTANSSNNNNIVSIPLISNSAANKNEDTHNNTNNSNNNNNKTPTAADTCRDSEQQMKHNNIRDWQTISDVLNVLSGFCFLISNSLVLLCTFPFEGSA